MDPRDAPAPAPPALDPPPPAAGAPEASPAGADARSGPSVGGWIVRGLLGLVGLALALVVAALVALQTRPGAEFAIAQIARLANPYEDATLSVEGVSGNWISNLRLTGLRLTRRDGSALAVIDTLDAKYNLLAIPGNRLHIREATLAGAYLDFRQGPDRVFDIQVPFLPDTLEIQDDSLKGKGLQLQLENLALRRVNADFEFYNPRADSIYRIRGLQAALPRLVVTDRIDLAIDSLASGYVLPQEIAEGTVRAGLTLRDDVLDVRGFRLVSSLSNVTAEGRLRLPSDTSTAVRDLDFRLAAAPLHFADLAVFVPALNPKARLVRADVRATGSSRLVNLDLRGVTGDSARIDLRTALTPPGAAGAGTGASGAGAAGAGGGAVRYAVSGQVRGLDPFYFTGGEQLGRNRFSLDLTTDLSGPSLDRVSGPISATLFDARFGDVRPERTTLNGRFETGELGFTLGTGYRGARLQAAGQLWPFDRDLRYNVAATFADVDVARIIGAGQATDLGGTLRLAGVGTSADNARFDARLDLDPSRVGPYRVTDARLTARYDTGRLRFASTLAVPEGGLQLAGDARLDRRVPTYRITDGRLTNFDVAAFTGQDVASRVNASFRAEGEGFDPETMRLDARLDLGPTVYDRYRIARGDARLRLTRGRLDAEVDAATNVGTFDVALGLRPFSDAQAIDIRRGTFRGVDVGAITGNPEQSSNLSGSVTGRISGFDPATMTADLRLALDDSRYNAQQIDRARVTASLRRGALTFDGTLDLPGGTTRLAGTARPFDGVPTFRVSRGTVAGLDLGALLNNPDLSTDLNGTFSLDGRGFDPKTMRLTADLAVRRSRYQDYEVDSGRVVVRVADGFGEGTLRAYAAGGRADLAASGRFFDDVPTYELLGAVSGLRVGEFLKNDSLDATSGHLYLGARGQGLDPRTMALTGFVRADSARYRTLTVDTLGTGFRLAAGVVYVDSLVLRSNAADARAHGYVAAFDSLASGTDLALDLALRDLAPVRDLLDARALAAQSGTVRARLYGRPGELRYSADGTLASLVYNDLQVADATVASAGEFRRDFTLASANGTVEVGYLRTPQVTIRQSQATGTFDGQTLALSAVVDADDRRSATVSATMDLLSDERRIDLDALELRFDTDRWRLARPASIGYGDRYRISNFLLESGPQQVVIDGVVDPRGQQNLVATIEGFRIGSLADIAGFQALDGRLSGTLDLTGPAAAPRLTGDLALSVYAGQDSVGTVEAALDYAQRRLSTDVVFRHRDGSTLAAKGFIPLDLSLAPVADTSALGTPTERLAVQTQAGPASGGVDLTVTADSFAVGWVQPFLDPKSVSRIDGRLVADVRVTGQLGAPDLAGTARLVRGRVTMPALGSDYRDIDVRLALADERINVDHIEVHSGRGEAVGSGRIDFPDLTLGQIALDLTLRDFQPIDNDLKLRRLSGPLRVRGTTERPRIEGDLNVTDADFYLTSSTSYEDVPLTAEDVREVEEQFGIRVEAGDSTVSQTFQNLALSLRLGLDRDVWLRSRSTPTMDIQLTGAVDVSKASGAPLPQIVGDIEVIPERSKVEALGRKFSIRSGLVQFNGDLQELLVDLAAEYQPRRPGANETIATITLSARGRPLVDGDLKIEFGSDPQMDTADILSYIATGRPSDQALAFGGTGGEGGGLLDTGAGLALGQLSSILEGVAGRDLGLDVIEVELDGTRGSQLTAGKYLSPRLYASLSFPITGTSEVSGSAERSTRIALEYALNSYLLAVLGYERQRVGASLRWDYSY